MTTTSTPTLAEIQAALADDDRLVDAIVPLLWAEKFPSNYRDDRGVVARVYGVRPSPVGVEVDIGHAPFEIWAEPIVVRLGWNLCDGCKAPLSQCCCEAIAADMEAEHGPWCEHCGSYGGEGCHLAHLYAPGQCPHITGVY